MRVEINHHPVDVGPETATLAQLLEHEGFSGTGQAVSVDNVVVPRAKWAEFLIGEGMKITVIQAVCGG